MAPKTLSRWLLMTIGILSVGLGTAGIFLPLLPTTPFLLFAAACFIRSSDRLYQWLIHNRWFGSYTRNYQEHRTLPLRAKVITPVLLWTTMTYSVLILLHHWALQVLLILIAAAVTVHLLSLKTAAKEMKEPEAD
jgi:uncharacterized membrane protein YbaN (DUF454 family)